ncbi:hypothetical protein [Burkholderia gladioli]|uniref:hypothetical protein n=1 Tax=Burkholderia gladioli TaxID=28095 RepID=UPI0031332935
MRQTASDGEYIAAVHVETGIESCQSWRIARRIEQQQCMSFEGSPALPPLDPDDQC